MINKPAVIEFNSQAGAWTDGTNYVKGSIIRRYAVEKLGSGIWSELPLAI